jgi:6-phosphofructo-2-kinase/fructose-2,6-biphosphatase
MEVNSLDPSKVYVSPRMVKSQSVGTMSALRKEDGQRGPFVDRGVGFPRFQKSSSLNTFTTVLNLDTDTEVCIYAFHSLFFTLIFGGLI